MSKYDNQRTLSLSTIVEFSSTISYIKSSTRQGLEFEGKAVENYNSIAKKHRVQ